MSNYIFPLTPGGSGGGGGGTSDTMWRPNVSDTGDLTWSRSTSTTPPSAQNIRGEKGDTGEKGNDGEVGKSAYQIWLDAGNTGTEQDFLSSLKGEKGADGTMTFDDLTTEQKESLKGDAGFSPVITENADNNEDVYKLDIKTATDEFTTPNLKGSGGGAVSIEFDDIPTENSDNAVKSGGIFEALGDKQDNIIILEGYKTQEEDGFGNYIIDPAPNCTYNELLEMLELKKRVVLRIYNGGTWVELYPVRNGNSTATYFVSPVWNTEKEIQELNVAFCSSTAGWKIGVKSVVGVPTGGTQGQVLTKTSDEDGEVEWSGSSPEPFIIKSSYTDTSEGFVVDTSNTVPVMWNDWYEHYLTGRQIIWELHKNTIDSGDDVIKMYINSIGIYDKSLNILEAQFTGVGTPTYYNKLYTNLPKFLYVAWFRSGSAAMSTYKNVKRFLINEIPTGGTTGQALVKKSDTDYDTEWADVSNGGIIVTCEYSVDDENNWTVSNVSETFATIDTALANNQEVILKAYPAGTTENPYILRPAMHYKNMGIMFALCVSDGGQISGLNIMIMADGSVTASNDAYDFEGKQDKIEGVENQIVGFDADGNAIAVNNEVIPIVENGKDVVQCKITKNRSITELESYTDPNGGTGYKIDDLYLTYDCEKLAKGFDDWFAEKGITPVKSTTYEDVAQIKVYSPNAGGYVYFSTRIKFDNTSYLGYFIKYNDTDYAIISVQYDYTNGKTPTTFTGLNVFNIAKIIPELAGCYIQSDILDVLHNWFELYKPIGLEDSVGLYSKTEALLNQDLALNTSIDSKIVGSFDLGNIVSFMTSPLQKLLFSVDSEGNNLKAFANDEKKRTTTLTNGLFGSNLLAPKNTFATLNDMSTLPTPPDGALGIWTVVPDAAGQPESTNKGGTLIIAHITSMLYSQTISYVGTRIAIYVVQGAIYYALGYGGKYYPTASWTPASGGAFRWYKISSTLI